MTHFHWKRNTGMALALLTVANAASTQAKPLPVVPVVVLPAATGEVRTLTLAQLGLNYAIKMRGVSSTTGIPFSVRADELITSASLRLNYAFSPSLIPELSHLRISVNNVEVQAVPLERANAGTPQTVEIPIARRLITDSNRINVELIGHYTRECEDPNHSSLWATIDASSALTMNVTPLKVMSNLAALPQPFFDRRDVRRVSVPFVFGNTSTTATSSTTLRTAGIVSSWFGALADYRGATFPVSVGELPAASHAVVFATPETIVSGLTLPAIQGPTVTVMDHPLNPAYKLLLVMGRTPAELKTAASALVLNHRALTGTSATITDLQEPAARKLNDAPRWLASNRPVELGELAPASDFTVTGYTPDVVKVNLHLPPDLFTWRSRGIPLDLRYRYTARVRPDQSTLNVSVNDTFIASLPLRSANLAKDSWWSPIAIRLMSDVAGPQNREVRLPPAAMGSRSQMRMHYYFEPPGGNCLRVLDNVSGSIDPTSTIDVSGFPHYIAMPELAAFANSGFPFTRMADLSETAVVLPDRAERGDIETYLSLMGQIGNATGYPALRVTTGFASEVAEWADKDLLVLGNLGNQPLFTQWAARMPLRRQPTGEQMNVGGWIDDSLNLVMGSRQRDDLTSSTDQMSVFDEGTDALLTGFESPLRSGRSVVAVVSSANSQQSLTTALLTPALLQRVQGSTSLIRGARVSSQLNGETYYVGRLPLIAWLQWNLSRNPLLLGGLVVLVAMLGAAAAFASLQMRARKRLK